MVKAKNIYRVGESKFENGNWGRELNTYYTSKKKAITAARITAEVMAMNCESVDDRLAKRNDLYYTNKHGVFCNIHIYNENLW